jgi:hypothetical protein
MSYKSVFYNGNVVKYQGCGCPVQSGLSVLRAPQVAPLQAHWIVGGVACHVRETFYNNIFLILNTL